MSVNSAIEWTESTWNPITGCTKISPGCKHCYAERMARRLQAMGQPNYARGFELTLHERALEIPLKWKAPQTIFVNSMSDLFHKEKKRRSANCGRNAAAGSAGSRCRPRGTGRRSMTQCGVNLRKRLPCLRLTALFPTSRPSLYTRLRRRP